MNKHQLHIATWPAANNEQFWGDRNYSTTVDSCSSAWINLRATIPDERWGDRYTQSVSNIGVYVWFNEDNKICLDLRLRDIYSATLTEAEHLIKTLKQLTSKAKRRYPVNTFVAGSDLRAELGKFFDALGVKTAIEYNGLGQQDSFSPVSSALERITATLAFRQASMFIKAA